MTLVTFSRMLPVSILAGSLARATLAGAIRSPAQLQRGIYVSHHSLPPEPKGRVAHTARPEWPVKGILFVSGEDPRRAFAAEVRGAIDWKARHLELSGEVTDGYMRGMRLTQTAELVDTELIAHNLSGA